MGRFPDDPGADRFLTAPSWVSIHDVKAAQWLHLSAEREEAKTTAPPASPETGAENSHIMETFRWVDCQKASGFLSFLCPLAGVLLKQRTLHDTEVFGVAVIGESESSYGLDLAKGTVH